MSRPIIRSAERSFRSLVSVSKASTSTTTPARRAAITSRSFSSSRCVRDDAPAASTSAPVSPKLAPIVDAISGLTLLEVADLVSALKTRLNISEIAVSAPAAAAPAPGAGAADAEAAEEKPKEKTIFTVKLEKIDAAMKAKVIREVKVLQPSMTLVEAKKFVESVPQVLKENLPKEDAEKLQKTLEALGATVSLS